MNKIFRSITIALVLTILSLPVLADMNGGNSNENSMDSGRNDSSMMNSRSNDLSSMHERAREMYDNGSRMRDVEGMMGMGFIHREDDNYGNYVTFSVDNTTGDVLNFGIQGISIFDSIKIMGFNFKETETEEAETKIVNKDGSIEVQIHDNPAAVVEIKADKKATLVYNLATGASAAKQDNIVKITAGNITTYIVSEKATSINIVGSQVSINTDIGDTIFRASPVNMPHDDMEDRFMEEMMTKRAGAEVSVGESDKYSIVNYSENVKVTVDSIETDRMRMTIDSSDSSGKFILMNIDNSSLMLGEGQKINLYLDNRPMKQVSTEQELYTASESSFWIGRNGGNKMQALVYISNFSAHQLEVVVEAAVTPAQSPITTTVTAPAATTAPAPRTPGFEIALGVLGTAAAAFIMRRRL